MKVLKNQRKGTFIFLALVAAAALNACNFATSGRGKATITVTPPEVSSMATPNPTPTFTPTISPTPTSTPTPTPSPTPTPTPKPAETFVTVGNKETGRTAKIGTYQYVADIHGIRIPDLEEFKEQIRQLPNLLYIDMCNCGLSNSQMEELCDTFPSVRFVWMIDMEAKKKDEETGEEEKLEWHVRTDALAFSTLHTGKYDPLLSTYQAERLKYCQDLVALDVGHNNVWRHDFMKNMNIHILIIIDTYDGDKRCMMDDLSVAANFTNLMYLECFVTGVKDYSFLDNCKEIRDLNISYTPVSDISHLKDFPHLERFMMEHTQINDEDYQTLCDTYPDVTIYRTGKGSIDHGWREHPRYTAMIKMFRQNYWDDLFRTEAELEDVAAKDLLIINGVRYYGTPYVQEMVTEEPEIDAEEEEFKGYSMTDCYGKTYSFANKIEASVGAKNIPHENNECNFDAVGNVYSTDQGDGKVLVKMADGKYHWFYKNEVLARLLIEKLDANSEIKEEYTREHVEMQAALDKAVLEEAEENAKAAEEEKEENK